MFHFSDLQEFTALDPIISDDCTTLILMSMPGVDSEREKFYFSEPHSQFWPLMSVIYHMPADNREERLQLLNTNHIGIWSIIKSCLRFQSREETIDDIVLNDMKGFLKTYPNITRIVCISHNTMRLLQEADPQAAVMASDVPSPSEDDLWFESVDTLIPEYSRALGVL